MSQLTVTPPNNNSNSGNSNEAIHDQARSEIE